MKWVYMATAPNQLVAEMWRGLLRDEGVQARIRSGDTSSFMGLSNYPCRIMVLEDQLKLGREILERNLGHPVE